MELRGFKHVKINSETVNNVNVPLPKPSIELGVHGLNEIDLHSEEMQEIIAEMPGWVNRWGIYLLTILFGLMLILSWFIKYPDLITAKVHLTTSPAPLALVARVTGNIKLLKAENSDVKKWELVAYITSNADPMDVLSLERKLSSQPTTIDGLQLRLGDLQADYTRLMVAISEYKAFKVMAIHDKEIDKLNQQLKSYKRLAENLILGFELDKQGFSIGSEKFQRDSLLFVQGVYSKQDYNLATSNYLQEKQTLRASESSIIQNQIQIDLLTRQIFQQEAQKSENDKRLADTIENYKRELLAKISKWKENFLFEAVQDGRLAYLSFMEDNAYVAQGSHLFSIVPNEKNIFAEAQIPIFRSGKVRTGQEVYIRLDNYPYQEFGMIKGEVGEILKFPANEFYLAEILIPKRTTTYNREIPSDQQLEGETDIITEDLRVIERVFYQLRSLIKR